MSYYIINPPNWQSTTTHPEQRFAGLAGAVGQYMEEKKARADLEEILEARPEDQESAKKILRDLLKK